MKTKLYEIFDKCNGIYYSTYPSSLYPSAEIKPIQFIEYAVNDNKDFYDNLNNRFEHFPDGDIFDEWEYYEPKDICIVSFIVPNGYDNEGEVEYQVTERFHPLCDIVDPNVPYCIDYPYIIHLVTEFEYIDNFVK